MTSAERSITVRKVVAGLFLSLDGVGSELKRLRVIGSRTTSTGVLIATYQPRALNP
jgi:hypothetical protein